MKKRTHILIILTLIITVLLMACDKSETIICGNCSATSPNGSQYCASCGTAFFQNNASTSTEFTGESTEDTPATNTSAENPQPTVGDNSESTETTTAQPTTSTSKHTHKYSAATCTNPKSCSCGATSGSALGHNWKSATCTSPKKCSRCGTTSGKVAAHNYSTKVTAPTCTAKGYTTFTCSACGDSYKDNYTNASHNYKNYKCTSCGTVDKEHAYDYLIEWVKANGVADEDGVAIVEYDDDLRLSITYDATDEYLYVSALDTKDGSYAYIDLSSPSQRYFYLVSYGQPIESSVSGKIKASSYTGNTPLSYENYHGPSNYEWQTWFLEYAQACLNLNIAFLSGFIKQCIPGITIADLGFTSY